MKSYLTVLFILNIFSGLSVFPQTQPLIEKWDLKGEVKSIIEYQFHEKLFSENDFIKGDTLCAGGKYFFDEKKRLVREETCFEEIKFEMDYKYDEYGFLSGEYNFGRLIVQYIYDDVGNRIKELFYDKEELIGHWKYLYDDKGHTIQRAKYYGKDLDVKWEMECNADGKVIKELKINRENDRSIDEMVVYKYDDKGNQVYAQISNPETGESVIRRYTYNQWNDITKWESKSDYNELSYSHTSIIHYTYDTFGNWIEKVEYFLLPDTDRSRAIIFERTIEYY